MAHKITHISLEKQIFYKLWRWEKMPYFSRCSRPREFRGNSPFSIALQKQAARQEPAAIAPIFVDLYTNPFSPYSAGTREKIRQLKKEFNCTTSPQVLIEEYFLFREKIIPFRKTKKSKISQNNT